jgi:uncharacterized protein YehS (DUF1456 family)
MTNNDVMRSVRFLLKLNDGAMADLVRLGGGTATPLAAIAWLRNDDEPGFVACPNLTMAQFLDGLVVHKRGVDPSKPRRPLDTKITNNLVLKTLRVAFELKEDDLLTMMHSSGFEVSRAEVSALFRAPGHRNFRPCGDQFLRNVLKSLGQRLATGT